MPPIDRALAAAAGDARRRAHAVLFAGTATPEAALGAAVVCERAWWLERDPGKRTTHAARDELAGWLAVAERHVGGVPLGGGA